MNIKSKYFLILVLIILVHIFILTKLIYFPYPEIFIYPYLTNHGLKPYSQILDQHFPGLLFLPINFDNLGLHNEMIARMWSMGIVIIIQLLIFFILRDILKSSKKALLANFLYLVWQPFFEGWVLWIDSLLPLLLLPAFYFLHKQKYFFAGLFIGLGIVFKQTLIPLSFLCLGYILWKKRFSKNFLNYLLGLILPIALMILYFAYIGVIKDLWYWTVIFNLTTYAKSGTSIPASIGFITRVLLVYLASLSLFFYKDKRLKIILLLFLIGSLAGIFDRANFVHFQPSLPFAILGTCLGIFSLDMKRLFRLGSPIYLFILYGFIGIWWLAVFYKGHIQNQVLFFDPQTKLVASKIKQRTNPFDKIFVFGAAPHLYQMSETLPSGNIFVFQFPWFLKVSENRILEGIKEDKPKVIISDRTVDIEGQKITDFAKDIDQYIQRNYEKVDSVGSVDILIPKSH